MKMLSNSRYTPDLRGFIQFLEAEHPEHVVRITKEVDPKFGVSGILERLERDGRFPLVIFENVKGSKFPLVANMHASFERLRLGLGMEHGSVKEFVKECAARQANPIDPVMVETAPVQEVVCVGSDIDVEELPICTYHEKDAGKYITAGLAVMRDPETGINNVGIYRHMVHEKNLLGVQLSETADGNVIWKKYEKRGLALPGRDRDRASPGFLHRLAVFLDPRFRRDTNRRRNAATAGAACPVQDHPSRGAGRRRDRARV